MSAKMYSSSRSTAYRDSSSKEKSYYINADVGPSASSSNKTASRIITSMRRTLTPTTPKKRSSENKKSDNYGMISTPAERAHLAPPRFRQQDASSSRPSIEQIAMGLHVSRTPHLRAQPYTYGQRNSAPGSQQPHHHTSPYDRSQRRSGSPAIIPPTPTRSSLKKSATSNSNSSLNPTANPGLMLASASSSTVTSMKPAPNSSNRSIAALKFRMARFLPGSRSASAPSSMLTSPVSSPRGSTSESQITKKAVRFSTHVVEADKD
ncbi:hypothetical protein BDZ94DRAFT_1311416 [Collybia nuda]|uniref:Uncharacterized protein n=1 Tax=Collybia nuda TaxID=64659 RepID=A0A9P5Y1C9_9AGAR|nr:hypothetical protein BDZ94DRAFT_1311416 [Collybia nuda]